MTNEDYEIKSYVRLARSGTTFVFPMARGTFAQVKEQLESEGITTPTMAQIADLAEFAHSRRQETEFDETIKRLDNNVLWGFNGLLYLPKAKGHYQNGVIIQDRPCVANGGVSLNRDNLIRLLEAGDSSVRFVPFGYKTGEQSFGDLAKNAFVIGLAGEEGAERIARLASRYKKSPKVWGFDNVNEETARVSCLGGLCDVRLHVCGDDGGDCDYGCASGVLVQAGGKA